MAKYYGSIGYRWTEETAPGINEEVNTSRLYYGDVLQFGRRLENNSEINDGINVNVKLSIVSDPFAYANFHFIIFAEWMGKKWKVTDVEPQYPRMILTLGGLYNE